MGKKADFKYEVAQTAAQIGIGKAAEMFAVGRKSVGVWLKLFKSGGRSALNNFSRQNQPSPNKLDEAVTTTIIQLKKADPQISGAEIKRRLNLSCSLAVVCKKIRQSGLAPASQKTDNGSWTLRASFKQLNSDWLFIVHEPNRNLIFTVICPEMSALCAAIWLAEFLTILTLNKEKSKITLNFSSDKITAGAVKLASARFSAIKFITEITARTITNRELSGIIKSEQTTESGELPLKLYLFQLLHNLNFSGLSWQLVPVPTENQINNFLKSITSQQSAKNQLIEDFRKSVLEKLLSESENCYKSGDLATTETNCQLLIELYQCNKNRSAYLVALRRLALVYQKKGNWQSAERYLLQAYSFSVKNCDAVQQGKTAALLANFFVQQADWTKAAAYARIQLQTAIDNQSAGEEINAQQVLGVIEEKRNRLQAAVAHYKRTLLLVETTGNLSVKAQALDNLGVVYYRQNKLRKAREYYEETIFLTEKIGDERQTARLYNNLGVIEEEQGRTKAALLCYQKMLDWANKHQNPNWQLAALINLGSLQNDLGEQQAALNSLRTAYELAVKFKQEENRSLILANLGEVYFSLKLPSKALNSLNRAIRIADRQENSYNLAGFYHQLTRMEFEMNHFPRAAEWLQKSMAAAALAERNDLAESNQLLKLQLAYRQKSDFQELTPILAELKNLADNKTDPPTAALAAVFLTIILSEQACQAVDEYAISEWHKTATRKCSLLWKKSGVTLFKQQIDILNTIAII